MKRILSTGLALGILTSGASFVTPTQKATAAVDPSTAGTVIKTLGDFYYKFIDGPFENLLEDYSIKNEYISDHENIAYKAPEFKNGEFSITYYDYYKKTKGDSHVLAFIIDSNGNVEIKTIKHGEQLTFRSGNVMVSIVTPGGQTHKNILITDNMLKEGKYGIAVSRFQTYFLQKRTSPGINHLLMTKYYPKENPAFLTSSQYRQSYFDELTPEKQARATITADVMSVNAFTRAIKSNQTGEDELRQIRLEKLFDKYIKEGVSKNK
ncbi:hypothetical protein [Bacillus cereus]|uniref:hypothetical protein n=1 Tax=Bacillus cereus TaxID=1396 RepID=UPI000BF2BE9A|nr:hypothetical protein [Bacillus cereus]PEQ56835.1 hypothetical protein CN469_25935 [Bacillus cereus]